MNLLQLLLYIHIGSVILTIGPFFVLIPLVKKLRAAESQAQKAYLETFWFTVRLTKHAGHVLVISGILLVIVGSWSWTTSWIVLPLILLLSSIFFLARAFSPILRKFGESDYDRGSLAQKLTRSIWIYIIIMMAVLWFMVTKPVLW
ncbi:hypothetical protein LSG31_07175 [Fodinisporobacter ferrooxydans]|uniref:DUF2269 domain-containing protein n=1 Tax=Fodinisporobacter ferrooxydans TaxID=2901836 RepID=A0ABY4CP27_9BACL|nr:hypothetical protein LSG31_07175 [Alicyclobacillaceae bacterium MYW30-H2]